MAEAEKIVWLSTLESRHSKYKDVPPLRPHLDLGRENADIFVRFAALTNMTKSIGWLSSQ